MFELYKKRDLSGNFSDTITFFKSFGKHFFKNFFIINGIFLMILIVLIYFISKIYAEVLFSNVGNPNNTSNYLVSYFNNNISLVIGSFIAVFILVVILSMLNISYPVIYLKLFEKTNSTDFSTHDIIKDLKQIVGKMIVFLIGTAFVIIPLSFIVLGLLFLLCFILIGIPLLIIVGCAFFSWITLSYYDYILNNTGFFTALSNGYTMVKQQFWNIVGTTFLILFLAQVIQGIITLIPYVISMVWMFTSSENLQGTNSNPENFSAIGILMAVMMVFSVLLSYIFNNFIIINQGLIYYGLKEESENNSTKSQIDLIGTDIE